MAAESVLRLRDGRVDVGLCGGAVRVVVADPAAAAERRDVQRLRVPVRRRSFPTALYGMRSVEPIRILGSSGYYDRPRSRSMACYVLWADDSSHGVSAGFSRGIGWCFFVKTNNAGLLINQPNAFRSFEPIPFASPSWRRILFRPVADPGSRAAVVRCGHTPVSASKFYAEPGGTRGQVIRETLW